MTTDYQNRDEQLQYEKQQKRQPSHEVKLISMNISLVKKYYHLVEKKKKRKQNELNLLFSFRKSF